MSGGMSDLGRTLLFLGLGLAVLGGLLMLGGRIPGLGRLPGDIVYRKGSFTFYFPVVTCLLLSLLFTLVLSLFRR
jgi:hypothetical protein